jgi:signal transduction histidine kinase
MRRPAAGQGRGSVCPLLATEREANGLGLGLTISRKGVEAMGGTLAVRDLPGKGCVFFIELPRLPDA